MSTIERWLEMEMEWPYTLNISDHALNTLAFAVPRRKVADYPHRCCCLRFLARLPRQGAICEKKKL